MKWEVRPHREVTAWLNGLDVQSRHQVAAAIDMITDQGPALREPLVKPIRGSRHHNMKELRPGSVGRTEIRILFIFDPNGAQFCWSLVTSPATGRAGTTRTSPSPTIDTTNTLRS